MPPERGICMCLQESNFKFIPIIVSNNNNDCNNNKIVAIIIYNPK